MNKFLELLKKLGFDLTGKEDQLKTALAELETASTPEVAALKLEIENLKKSSSQSSSSSQEDKTKDNEIAALKNDISGLTKLLTELQAQGKTQAEAAKLKMEKDRADKIASLKAKGIAEGRITEANWEKQFKAIAEKDVDSFETLLPSLAIDPHFKPSPKEKTKTGDNNNNTNDLSLKGPFAAADKTILGKITEMNNN